jgi:hypothetical protein
LLLQPHNRHLKASHEKEQISASRCQKFD